MYHSVNSGLITILIWAKYSNKIINKLSKAKEKKQLAHISSLRNIYDSFLFFPSCCLRSEVNTEKRQWYMCDTVFGRVCALAMCIIIFHITSFVLSVRKLFAWFVCVCRLWFGAMIIVGIR